MRGFTLFDTAIGACAVAWSEAGLIATQLPELGRDLARRRLARRVSDCAEEDPPEWVRGAIGKIIAHLAGERVDYAGVPLDERGIGEWEHAVYRAAAAIPPGETRTYGALAAGLGRPEAAQAVGQALGRNPWPIVVPCHRILAADGKTGGFSAPGGVVTKLKLLEIEGALAPGTLPLFASSAD
ncbi:MAG: methylated-DNA--[protein]-cysteine S-methyltransferase [Sphingosinicella sp.]